MSLLKRRPDHSLVLDRPEFYIQTGSMFENPYGVPPDEIVRFIAENPAEVVAQVVFGKYVESSGLVFTGELVQRLFDRALPRIAGNTYIDETAAEQARLQFRRFGRYNNRFYTGIDFARQTDYTVITTLDTLHLPAKVVYFKRLNRVPWDSIYAEVGRAAFLWGPNLLGDSTGPGGDSALNNLEGRNYCYHHHHANLVGSRCVNKDGSAKGCDPADYIPLSCIEGFQFTSTTKKELVDHLRVLLGIGYNPRDDNQDFGWLRSPPIVQLEEELSFYAWDDKRLVTDCLFSLALAAWMGLEERIQDAVRGSIFGG